MNPEPLPNKPDPCQYCFGTGYATDTSYGSVMKARRLRCQIGMREMSRGTGIPRTNLARLENGTKLWTLDERTAYLAECFKIERQTQ